MGTEPAKSTVLLLTGVPGVGKTTVLRRAAEQLAGRRPGGFYTEELRTGGARQGFRLIGFGGRECVIAHVDYPKRTRVGKYGVDVAAIDAAAEELLTPRADTDLYLVDEIGKMECLSARFVAAMRRLLESRAIVVASIAKRAEGFIAEVKRRPDVTLWEVTHANRDALPARVCAWIEAARAGRP